MNDSDEEIYVSFGGTAVLNEGVRLNSNGGSTSISQGEGSGLAINAICASGTKNLTVTSLS